MQAYQGKLLELVAIDTEASQPFLQIRLTFEQDIELLWKIDADTANHLKAVTALGQSHKYRLSFSSFWDANHHQYVSFLTRTYRDQSEKVYFPCSEAYVNGLNAIKYSEQISHIQALHFLTSHSQSIKPVQQKTMPNRLFRKFSWIAVATILITATISYGHSPMNKLEVIHNITAKANGANNEIPIDLTVIEKSPLVDQQQTANSSPEDSKPEPVVSVSEPILPTSVLDEVISYSIQAGTVALTFDDGPSKYTKEITDILKNYKVGGTFFFIGKNVLKYPNHVQYVHANGYKIGSHSMNHTDLIRLSYEKQELDLLHTNQLIEDVIQEKVTLFRPPYGSNNEDTLQIMNNNQAKMVLWNTDTQDWKSHNADKIMNAVRTSKTSGSIILLHESQAVVDALPQIIDYLQSQDLQIVNLQ